MNAPGGVPDLMILDGRPYRVLHGNPDIIQNAQLEPISWRLYIWKRLGLP